jgi:hypothetical protein
MTSHTDNEPTQVLGLEERAELERLRAEVLRLRAEAMTEGPESPPRRRRSAGHWGRTIIGALLILVSCVLAPLSVVSVWARSEVTDTDRYVDTVAPLAQDPAIQQAITTNLTNVVFQYIDVDGITTQTMTALSERDIVPPALATQLQALAVPIASGIRSFTQDQIGKVVQSDAFAQAWEQANRTAHQQLVAALTGESSTISVQDNAVRVDLAAFLGVVKQRLVDSGFELAAKIPQVNATFTVFESADIGKVQRGFDLLDTLGYWLPFILVALAGLGIYLVPNHRLAFVWTGVGVTLAMLATAIALQYARSRYLAGVPASLLPPDAAAVLFDSVVRYLREAVRALALIGILAALGAFLTGPSVTAVTVRRWIVNAIAAAKRGVGDLGLRLDGITRWVAPRATLLRGVAVAAVLAVLLLERYRTPSLVLWLTVGLLAALAVIEFLAVDPGERRRRGVSSAPVPVPVPATPS